MQGKECMVGREEAEADRKAEDAGEVEAKAEAFPLANDLPNPNKVLQITKVGSCQ